MLRRWHKTVSSRRDPNILEKQLAVQKLSRQGIYSVSQTLRGIGFKRKKKDQEGHRMVARMVQGRHEEKVSLILFCTGNRVKPRRLNSTRVLSSGVSTSPFLKSNLRIILTERKSRRPRIPGIKLGRIPAPVN